MPWTSITNLSPQDNLFAGSVAAAEVLDVIDATAFSGVTLQVYGTFVATLLLEGSNDGSNWVSLQPVNVTPGGSSDITAAGIWTCPINVRTVRVRCSAYTSGTVNVAAIATKDFDGEGLRAALTSVFGTSGTVIAAEPDAQLFEYQFNGAVSINTDILTIDCADIRTLSIQCVAIGASGVLTPYWSNDGVNWVAATLNAPGGATAGTISTTGIVTCQVLARYFKLRVTTGITSGTTDIEVYGFSTPTGPVAAQNVVGSISTTDTPTTPTTHFLNSTASTNLTSVKASAGTLFHWLASNQTGSTVFLKLYNKASAPVPASDIPILTISIAAGSIAQFIFGTLGMRCSAGIAFSITGAAADTDTTAVAAGVRVNTTYL